MPKLKRCLLALALLLCLPPAPRALATSWECLRSGIEQCGETPGDQDRAACLDAFLASCSYYCGTVDDDCAKRRLAETPLKYWREAGRLSSRVADGCVVKPNCPPPPRPTGPAELLKP